MRNQQKGLFDFHGFYHENPMKIMVFGVYLRKY